MSVVPFRPRPRVFTSREAFIDEVRAEIFASPMRYRDIANRAEVTTATISNLARNVTQWPKPKTLFGVINALGLAIRLERRR